MTTTTASIRKRLGRTGVVSILAIALIAAWLIRYPSVERSLPYFSKGGGSGPRVALRQGTYVGFDYDDGYPQVLEQFLGISYGQSTAGERRFREPLPVNASTKTFEAKEYGHRCPSGPEDGSSEDCLNLNIFRPKERPQGKSLPVLVHIYGGSFNFGFDRTRDIPNMVAWSAEPFVGVSFNYRIGALGFLTSELALREGLLNNGLKDQALLLQWVQDNIAEFGGDPGEVTIMGSSAGAHSIGHHLMHNPTAAPPFHRLIIESGGPTARAVYTPTNPLHEEQFQKLLIKLEIPDTNTSSILPALRDIPLAQFVAGSETIYKYYNPSVRWPFQPVIDGPSGFIAQSPISAWREGKFHRVPILTGFNTNEGAAFVPMKTQGRQFTAFFHTLLPSLTDEDLKLLNELYPDPVLDPESKYKDGRKGIGAQFKRLEAAYGQFAYVCPVRHTAHFAAKQQESPVYLYHFAVNSSIKGGADHGTHNPFSTYSKSARGSETLNEVAGSMHAYWTSFITSGDPNKVRGRFPARPAWPVYEAEGKGQLVMFGEGNDEKAGGGHSVGVAVRVADDEWAAKECEFWWERTDLFEL